MIILTPDFSPGHPLETNHQKKKKEQFSLCLLWIAVPTSSKVADSTSIKVNRSFTTDLSESAMKPFFTEKLYLWTVL